MTCLVLPLTVHSTLSNLKYMLESYVMDECVSVCSFVPSGSVSVLTIIFNYQCVLQSKRRDGGEETQT